VTITKVSIEIIENEKEKETARETGKNIKKKTINRENTETARISTMTTMIHIVEILNTSNRAKKYYRKILTIKTLKEVRSLVCILNLKMGYEI